MNDIKETETQKRPVILFHHPLRETELWVIIDASRCANGDLATMGEVPVIEWPKCAHGWERRTHGSLASFLMTRAKRSEYERARLSGWPPSNPSEPPDESRRAFGIKRTVRYSPNENVILARHLTHLATSNPELQKAFLRYLERISRDIPEEYERLTKELKKELKKEPSQP